MHTFGKVAVIQAKFEMLAGNYEPSPQGRLRKLQDSCIPLQKYIGLWDQLPPRESGDDCYWSHVCYVGIYPEERTLL